MSNVSLPTETAPGRAWVEKYLHPPSVQRSAFVATPDNNISPVTTLSFETVNNIPLVGSIGTPPVIVNFSEIMFLQTTGARVVSYVFVRSPTFGAGQWFQHPQFPAIINDSYDFVANWGADVSLSRLSYKSCTYYLNSTAFNDQGTVTIAQARPAIFVSSLALIPPMEDQRLEMRSRLGNEAEYNTQVLDVGDVSGQGVGGAYVPASPTQLQQSNPKAVTHLARDGAFVPQHWSQPINKFYVVPDIGNGSEQDLLQCYIRYTDSAHAEHAIPLYVKMAPNGTIPAVRTLENSGDTTWTDFTIAYVYFSGLSIIPATVPISNAYITVKSLYGVEIQPCVRSSFVFFQQTPPIPDDRAIHVAAAIVHQKPDGFPAAANDLGSILALAATYAPKVISWLSNAFAGPKAVPAAAAPVVVKKDKKKIAKDSRQKPAKVASDVAKLTRDVAAVRLQRRSQFQRMRPVGWPGPVVNAPRGMPQRMRPILNRPNVAPPRNPQFARNVRFDNYPAYDRPFAPSWGDGRRSRRYQ